MGQLIIDHIKLSKEHRSIVDKVFNNERISSEEGLILFKEFDLPLLAQLANYVKERKNGNVVYFNKNFHIEPTNKCVFDCKFCSYSRMLKDKQESWELSEKEMLDIVEKYKETDVSEVHIVGGVHPKMNLEYFSDLVEKIKNIMPGIHVKAFTAVELEYMFRKGKKTYDEGFQLLKKKGLGSIPGGGAEIFDESIRKQICDDKCTSDEWLAIHRAAHNNGLHSNATILYGHIEHYEHRIDHMLRLRELQDETGGFNTFIPLKFRNKDNQMSDVPEVSIVEDMRNYAVSRIFMDNFNHLKAYWPMIGREAAQTSLNYGVDDLDGTIDDSTKIYSMAGSEEQNPAMTTEEIVGLIKQTGRIPVERDTLYNTIREYSEDAISA